MPVCVFVVGSFAGTEKFSMSSLFNMLVISAGVATASYGRLPFYSGLKPPPPAASVCVENERNRCPHVPCCGMCYAPEIRTLLHLPCYTAKYGNVDMCGSAFLLHNSECHFHVSIVQSSGASLSCAACTKMQEHTLYWATCKVLSTPLQM
jgi:hypothetical protein